MTNKKSYEYNNIFKTLLGYWEHTAKRDGTALREYFHLDATIYLHDTTEILSSAFKSIIGMTPSNYVSRQNTNNNS